MTRTLSFRCRETEKLFHNIPVKRFAAIDRVARRKLLLLESAETLQDLKSPPGNRLEGLNGDRKGQYSIRINDQWRLCFVWNNGVVNEVEIVDYHRRG